MTCQSTRPNAASNSTANSSKGSVNLTDPYVAFLLYVVTCSESSWSITSSSNGANRMPRRRCHLRISSLVNGLIAMPFWRLWLIQQNQVQIYSSSGGHHGSTASSARKSGLRRAAAKWSPFATPSAARVARSNWCCANSSSRSIRPSKNQRPCPVPRGRAPARSGTSRKRRISAQPRAGCPGLHW
jgi:hypothetical protein